MKTRLLKKLRKEFHKNYKVIWHDGVYWICEWDGSDGFWYICDHVKHGLSVKNKQTVIKVFDELWHNFALNKVKDVRLNKTRVEL